MTTPTASDLAEIERLYRAISMRSSFDMCDDRERRHLAEICYKIGCDVDAFIRLVTQMGLDQLCQTDLRVYVWFSALCDGKPQLDFAADDLPF